MNKVNITNSCWLWTGARSRFSKRAKTRGQYGRFRWHNTHKPAHVASYIIHVGPIPDRLLVMHTCDNPQCVNPSHLVLGTSSDNQRDSVAKGRHRSTKKTHCLRGHPLNGNNLYVDGKGARSCKICRRAALDKFYGKRKLLTSGKHDGIRS